MLSFGLEPSSMEISDSSNFEIMTVDSFNNTNVIIDIENISPSTSQDKSPLIIQNTNFGNYVNYFFYWLPI